MKKFNLDVVDYATNAVKRVIYETETDQFYSQGPYKPRTVVRLKH